MDNGKSNHYMAIVNKWGWIMWCALALSFLVVYFHRVSLAVVMDYLMADLAISEAAVAGTLAGMYSIIYLVMQIPSGLLADFWGARKTVTAGMLVAALGSVLFALATGLFLSFTGRAIVGLGVSVIYVSILKFLTSWFRPNQFATMTGLTILVGNIGGALGTVPMALLVTGFGWRNSFFLIGVITFFIAVLCWLIVKDTPEAMLGVTKRTSGLWIPASIFKRWTGRKGKDSGEPGETAFSGASCSTLPSSRAGYLELMQALKKVLRNRYSWYLFMSILGVYGTLIAFTGAWSISYLMHVYGFTRGEAANYMLAVTVGMMVGCPLVGYISDRLGRRKWPHLAFFLLYILFWALLLTWNRGRPPVNMLYPLFFSMGLAASTVVIIFATCRELNEPAYAGVALGVVNMGAFAGISILQPLLGYVLDLRWDGAFSMGSKIYPLASYHLLFATCLTTLLVCFLFALSIRETYCRNIYKELQRPPGKTAKKNIGHEEKYF